MSAPTISPPVTFGGIDWHTTDSEGVEWYCENLSGWSDLPETDAELMARALDYGAYYGDTYYAARLLVLDGAIVAPNQYALISALNDLRSQHWQSLRADVPLTVSEADGPKYLNVRAGKTAMTVHYISPLAVRVSIELYAAWPVKRNDVKSLTAQATTPGHGRTYPRGGSNPWWRYGESGSTGDMRVTNNGNAIVRPQFVIAGPVTNPRIINADQNRVLAFNIALMAGDLLGIDTDTHAVVLNNVGNRRYVLSSDSAWFELMPGVNTIQYRSDTNSGSLTCYFTDGWW
jgi:hypothetical protein